MGWLHACLHADFSLRGQWNHFQRKNNCQPSSFYTFTAANLTHSLPPPPAPPPSQDLRAKLLLLSDGDGQQLMRVQEENSQLRRELAARERTIAELEVKLQRAGVPTSAALGPFGLSAAAEPAARAGSLPVPAVGAAGSLNLPVTAGAGSMPLPTLVSVPSSAAPQPQLMVAQQQMPVASLAAQLAPAGVAALPPAPVAPALPSMGAVAQPTLAVPDAAAAAAAAQQQVQALAGVQPQVVVSMAPSVAAAPQVLLQAASGAVQVAQPAATTLSGGALAAAAAGIQPAAPAMTTLSNDALSGEAAAAAASMQALVGAGVTPALSGEPGVAAQTGLADQAAHTLSQQAAQLTAQASLHAQAKTQASTQAQQLANQAQLHAQASVQAAVQAEQLKQTLAVLPDNPSTQQTVATVQDLESKAKAHADITTQVGRAGGRTRCRAGWLGNGGLRREADASLLSLFGRQGAPGSCADRSFTRGLGDLATVVHSPTSHPHPPTPTLPPTCAGGGAGAGDAGEGAGACSRAGQGHGAGQHAAGTRPVAHRVGAAAGGTAGHIGARGSRTQRALCRCASARCYRAAHGGCGSSTAQPATRYGGCAGGCCSHRQRGAWRGRRPGSTTSHHSH